MQRGLRNCPPNRPNPTVLTGTALASVPASAALPEPGEPDASAKAREFSLSLPSKDVTSLKEADKAGRVEDRTCPHALLLALFPMNACTTLFPRQEL